MAKKTSFRSDFGPLGPKFYLLILPLVEVRHCCKLSFYVNSRKTNEPNLRKWQKTYFRARSESIWPKFRLSIFFFKNLASTVTRYHGQLSSCTISEKTNGQILRKLSDGRRDEGTDGRE